MMEDREDEKDGEGWWRIERMKRMVEDGGG